MQKRTDLGKVASILHASAHAAGEYHRAIHERFGLAGMPVPHFIDKLTRTAIEQATGEPITLVAFEMQTRVSQHWLYVNGLGQMIDLVLTKRERDFVDTLVTFYHAAGGAR